MLKSVVKGCQLCIWNYLGFIIFAYAFWVIELSALALTIAILVDQPTVENLRAASIFHLFGLAPLVAGVAWFALLLGIWQGFLQLLWSKPPRWLRVELKSFFWDIGISILAVLPIVIAFVSKTGFITWRYAETAEQAGAISAYMLAEESLPFIEKYWWMWVLTAIILCFLREQKQTN